MIGGWTEPAGSRTHFGALLAGQYEAPGVLRFVGRVGTGFDDERLRTIAAKLRAARDRGVAISALAARANPRFRPPRIFAGPSWYAKCASRNGPRAACYAIRASSASLTTLTRLSVHTKVRTHRCPSRPRSLTTGLTSIFDRRNGRRSFTSEGRARPVKLANNAAEPPGHVEITHADKVFWPAEGYTKGDLIEYYETIAPWMLPYLKDRPVMLTRYPDGIEGKSFFQKDAPGFAPPWIRRVKIYSEDSEREISYFILESAEASEIYRQHGCDSDPHLVIARAESQQSRLAIVRYRSQGIDHHRRPC